jgi:hypothetical protein
MQDNTGQSLNSVAPFCTLLHPVHGQKADRGDGITQMYLSEGKREKAEEHSIRLEQLVEPEDYERATRNANLKQDKGRIK